MKRSNLIPITRIYDIYPKYTYSEDVKKFMDEIVDIDRVNVFTKADMVDILDKIRAEIDKWHHLTDKAFNDGIDTALEIIDKYKTESEVQDADSD